MTLSFEPWRSEAEHDTPRSRWLPTILTFKRWWGRNIFCFFQTAEIGNRTPNSGVKGSGANHYPRAPARLRNEPRRQVKIYIFNVYSSHYHRRCWPTSIWYLPGNRAAHVSTILTIYAYPPNFSSMLRQCRSPLPTQCRQIVYNTGQTLLHVYLAAAPQ